MSTRAEVEYGPNFRIGRGSKVSSFTKIKVGKGLVQIGENTSIATGGFLSSSGGSELVIGRDCLIGPSVTISANNYRYDRIDIPIVDQGYTTKGIRIGDNVWIGSGCSIMDGADIGDGAIISANSMVTGSIEENAVAQGNPAKVIFVRR